jgi:hypothetical protein
MKDFRSVSFDRSACQAELHRFRALLASAPELGERSALLPFFRTAPHLSAFLGSYSAYVTGTVRVAYQYPLFGDFTADLVIADSTLNSFCVVEFEDARSNSVFVARRGKSTPEWSPRFEHGFSQLVDWFWRLDDARGSTDFLHRFGPAHPRLMGMLVLGRDAFLGARERQRLAWRMERVLVDSKHITCVTYDQLVSDLTWRLQTSAA